MKKVIIFGSGGMGQAIYNEIKEKAHVICFWDNNSDNLCGNVDKIPIRKPHKIALDEADEVILGACYPSMRDQLIELGISEEKINDRYVERRITSRIKFLENFSILAYARGIEGNVAECGVFQGEFAQHINQFFPDRKLYLFDTFEGFAEKDVKVEKNHCFSNAQIGQYSLTSEKLVLERMRYPEQCIVKKGLFPASAKNVEGKFCFVNLDMDLYQPTLEGLNYFCDKMVTNGVILVHDYFSHYHGVEQAVSEFLKEKPFRIVPIGDEISVAIVGF